MKTVLSGTLLMLSMFSATPVLADTSTDIEKLIADYQSNPSFDLESTLIDMMIEDPKLDLTALLTSLLEINPSLDVAATLTAITEALPTAAGIATPVPTVSTNNESSRDNSERVIEPQLPEPVQPELPEPIVPVNPDPNQPGTPEPEEPVFGVDPIDELDLKRGLSPKDQEAWQTLFDNARNPEMIQRLHDIMEGVTHGGDGQPSKEEGMNELLSEFQEVFSEMSATDKFKTLMVLNNISVNNSYNGYDSVLDQLVNGWGYGSEEFKTKFNEFNTLDGAEKREKIAEAIADRTPSVEPIDELVLKRGLSPKDQEAWQTLFDNARNPEMIQRLHDIMEGVTHGGDEQPSKEEGMNELLSEFKETFSEMTSTDKIKTFMVLNNISVNNAYNGYDSVLDQLVNGWGYGSDEFTRKFNEFNALDGAEKRSLIEEKRKEMKKAYKKSNDSKRADRNRDRKVSKSQREKIRREIEKRRS